MKSKFKVNKNSRILALYQYFLDGKVVNKAAFSVEYDINERTFERDIAEIRNFLSDSFSIREVIYDRINDVYYLSGVSPKYIDKMETMIISKILLESRVLCVDELKGLIENLLITVNPYEVEEVASYIRKDVENYKSEIKTPILKLLNDLYILIEKGNDIKYVDVQGNSKIISPIKIKMQESKFILVASEGLTSLNYIEINLEEISSFVILDTHFAKKIQQKYFTEREVLNDGN